MKARCRGGSQSWAGAQSEMEGTHSCLPSPAESKTWTKRRQFCAQESIVSLGRPPPAFVRLHVPQWEHPKPREQAQDPGLAS